MSTEELLKAVEAFINYQSKDSSLRFYTSGTGIPDKYAVDYFRKTNVIVITRDGREYLKGNLKNDSGS